MGPRGPEQVPSSKLEGWRGGKVEEKGKAPWGAPVVARVGGEGLEGRATKVAGS